MQASRQRRAMAATAAVTGAALLAFSRYGVWPARSRVAPLPPSRLTVVGVAQLSWDTVLGSGGGTNLAYLSGFLAGASAKGDLIGRWHHFEAEILASLVTGQFPRHHGVSEFGAAILSDGDGHPFRRAVWDRISRHGRPVAVVGYPLWYPLRDHRSLVVPPWALFARDRLVYRGRDGVQDTGLLRKLVTPEAVPDVAVRDVVGNADLPPSVVNALRLAQAADLTMAAVAEHVRRGASDLHLFVYFEGLRILAGAMEASGPPTLTADAQAGLTARYHVFLDSLLARVGQVDTRTTVVIFSEMSNALGPIHYRPHFPKLDQWPPMGFFAAKGRAVKETVFPETVSPPDLAVTLLHLVDLPIPACMDGVILYGIFDDDYYFKHPLRSAP